MFEMSKIYTVHLKPSHRPGHDYPVFVREGFNFFAFLFTLLWAFYQRLWLAGVLILAFHAAVMLLQYEEMVTSGGASVLLLGMQLIVGFHGNDWLRRRLMRQGYIVAGIAAGDSFVRAEQRFFEQYLQTPAPAV